MDKYTLKEKSEINIVSALLLTSKEDTCLSSVHCSYYSCYQLVIHYLDESLNYNDQKRKDHYSSYKSNQIQKKTSFLGLHDYWISEFIKLIEKKAHLNSCEILKNLKFLKQARGEADYKCNAFHISDTNKLYDIARKTIKLINNTYIA